MTRKKFFNLLLILTCYNYSLKQSTAQCTSATANTETTTIIPTTSWQTVVFKSGSVPYIEFSATTGNTYIFTCAAAVGGSCASNDQFSMLTTSNVSDGGVFGISFLDDFTSDKEVFAWSPSSNGTYRIALSRYNSGNCQNLSADASVAYISLNETQNFSFWIGDLGTTWTGSNWISRTTGTPVYSAPTSSHNVTIYSGSSNQPSIGSGTNADCLNLTINSGATLTNAASVLGLGDFDIYGNFINNGTFNHTGDAWTYLRGSGKTLGGTGTFTTSEINFYNNSSTTLTNNVQLYSTSISSTGPASLNLDSYTLIITNTLTQNGTIDFGSGTINYQGSATPTLTESRFIENYGTMIYGRSGNQTIVGGITYNHLQIDGSGTKTSNAATDVNGNLTISAGTFSCSTYNITLAGNWTNNGVGFTYGTKKVTLDGTTSQSISGSTATTFHDLEITNTSANVTLTVNASINGTLTLSNGNLIINTGNTLTIDDTDDPGISGGSSASHIVTSGTANIQKTYTSTTPINFPLGDGTNYRPIKLTPSSTNNTIWTISYTPSVYGNTTIQDESPSTTLDHISQSEYWTCDRSGGAPSNSTLEFTWHSGSNVDDYNNLRIAHFDGTDWNLVPSTPVGTNSSGTLTSDSPESVFSPFTIGSINGNNPLPVKLLSFDAECVGDQIILKWTTASEVNNDYYTIERSYNGQTFEIIGMVNGAGFKNDLSNYAYIDNKSIFASNIYYRLKQTDFDGKFEYFDIIESKCSHNELISLISNKLEENIEISYYGDELKNYSLKIINQLGKIIYNEMVSLCNNVKIEIPVGKLANGIYFIVLQNNNELISRKIIL